MHPSLFGLSTGIALTQEASEVLQLGFLARVTWGVDQPLCHTRLSCCPRAFENFRGVSRRAVMGFLAFFKKISLVLITYFLVI